MRGITTPSLGQEEEPSALRRGWQKGAKDARAEGPSGTLAYLLPGRGSNRCQQIASHPGIRRHSAASAAAAAPRGANTKLPATTATPLPSDGSYLGPSWVRLRNGPLQLLTSSADGPRRRRWPPRSLRVTQFFIPVPSAGRRGKTSQRPSSAQARWEASRARLRGWAPSVVGRA